MYTKCRVQGKNLQRAVGSSNGSISGQRRGRTLPSTLQAELGCSWDFI